MYLTRVHGSHTHHDLPVIERVLIAKVSLDRRALGWVLFSGPPGGWGRVCSELLMSLKLRTEQEANVQSVS